MTKSVLISLLALLVVIANSSPLVADPFANPRRTTRGQNPPADPIALPNARANSSVFERLPRVDEIPFDVTTGIHANRRSNDWIDGFAATPFRQTNALRSTRSFTESRSDAFAFEITGELPEMTRVPLVEVEAFTFRDLFAEQWTGIRSDHAEFYSPRSLAWLAGAIGAGAVMANTGFDEHFVRDTYIENIVLAPSDDIYEKLHQPKFFGDGFYTIPAFAIAALAEPLIDDMPLGSETSEWGQRSLRTILVGGPPLLGLQILTGGGRPNETHESSEWQPFRDNNGVSGHAFMGAIPFMSAAKMSDNSWLKGGLYAASALPAISRVNDDAHYFSQAFLGWWLAYLAESAVDRSHDPNANHRFFAYPQGDGLIVGVALQR